MYKVHKREEERQPVAALQVSCSTTDQDKTPPSAFNETPVVKFEASLAKYSAALAISLEAAASLSWICCTAVFKITSFFTSAEANLVLVRPGSRALQRIPTLTWAPCRSSSLAMASPMSRLAPETKVNQLSSRALTSFHT